MMIKITFKNNITWEDCVMDITELFLLLSPFGNMEATTA